MTYTSYQTIKLLKSSYADVVLDVWAVILTHRFVYRRPETFSKLFVEKVCKM